MKERVEHRSFSLPLRCNYLLAPPARHEAGSLLVLALHGHSMTPEEMLTLSRRLVGDRHVIASLQGPYQFWRFGDPERGVAFHWQTSFQPEESRRLHHEMVLQVLRELAMPATRTVLVGFSQSVSLNYRFLCTHTRAVRGAVAVCGGLPSDWDEAPYANAEASVLHHWYPPATTEPYPYRLRQRIPDVEFHLLDGGHRIPSAGRSIVEQWIERVFPPRDLAAG